MAGTFEISTRSNGEFQFNLKAGNGQVILSSEGYASKAGCTNGIESVKKNATDDSRYEKKESKSGQPFFVLKAGNSQVIGQSQMYKSASARDSGIESVKTHAPGAKVSEA